MKVLFFIFIFFNFLNPISPVLTIIIDVLIMMMAAKSEVVGGRMLSRIVVFCSVIWLWSLIVMLINNNLNTYIFFKYLRMPIMAIIISTCVSKLKFNSDIVLKSLYYLCLVNVLSIWIELYFPSTRDLIAKVLNISRVDAASFFENRVMGIAGSFESCSIMCILIMIIAYIKYQNKNSLIDLLVIFVAFASMIFVSRTGMLIGAFILIYMLFGLFKASKSYHKIIVGSFAFSIVFVTVAIMLPILINSSGLFEEAFETGYALELGEGFGSGTAGELTKGSSSHMNILKAPISELILGYGINSEDFAGKNIATDIGYLEFICHIGIIGLALVIILHLFIMKYIISSNKRIRRINNMSGVLSINRVNLMYLVVLFVFNYKLMLLFSRGTFELLLILLFASEKLLKNQRKQCQIVMM